MLRGPFAFRAGLPRFAAFLCLMAVVAMPNFAFAQTKVSGSDNFTLIIDDAGNVWGFGNNSSDQLGLATTTVKSPTQIPGLSGVVAVAAGGIHSLALTSTGVLYAWGGNTYGQVGDGSNTLRSSPQVINLSNVVGV